MNRTNRKGDHRTPWIPLVLVVVLIAAAYVAGSPTADRAAAPDPPKPESAGGPASPTRPFAPSVDPGASPSVPGASPQVAAAAVALPRSIRSPLERSPGYFPPDDPESLSLPTGRRAAPRVDGDFEGGAPTFETLLQAALVAIERGDEPSLHALRITRPEFERFLWREFPQSRPVTNIRAEDAWGFISSGSLAGAGRAVASFGGRRFAVLRVQSSGPLPYTNFTLWRDVVVTARDESSGEMQTLRFLPAVVERRGRFKVFSFKD